MFLNMSRIDQHESYRSYNSAMPKLHFSVANRERSAGGARGVRLSCCPANSRSADRTARTAAPAGKSAAACRTQT